MNYIQGLLIMEEDLDDNDSDLASSFTGMEQTPTAAASPKQGPSPPGTSVPSWCKCCEQQRCVTIRNRFQKLSLDPDVLQLTIHIRGDIRNEQEDNSTRSFRKPGYRPYVLA